MTPLFAFAWFVRPFTELFSGVWKVFIRLNKNSEDDDNDTAGGVLVPV